MKGALRFARSVTACIGLAVFAFVMQYGQDFLFRSAEHPTFSSAIGGNAEFVTTSRSPQRSQPQEGSVLWRMSVVTNRQVDHPELAGDPGGSNIAKESLADQVKNSLCRTQETTYGQTPVTVSLRRKRGTCNEGPNGVNAGRFTFSPRDEFLQSLSSTTQRGLESDVLVYIHGFNVSLQEATARAAQVAEDMPFHGTMVVFSWQSAARTQAYMNDENQAERYFWNLAELLVDIKETCDSESRLHILAHSMGNRVTLRAIEALCGTIDPTGRRDPIAFARYFQGTASTSNAQTSSVVSVGPHELNQRFPNWGLWHARSSTHHKIDTLVLVAPDVGVAEFSTAIRNIRSACDRMVLYCSDSDYALKGSQKLHGNQYRAGDSRANLNLKGLHTVRVSGVDSRDPLGHSYYGSNTRVLQQLGALLNAVSHRDQNFSQFAKGQAATVR